MEATRMFAVVWGVDGSVDSVWPTEREARERLDALGGHAHQYDAAVEPRVVMPDFKMST